MQTYLLLMNLKAIADKLQSDKAHFKTQGEILKIEKKQLIILNRNLKNKVGMLENHLKKKYYCQFLFLFKCIMVSCNAI